MSLVKPEWSRATAIAVYVAAGAALLGVLYLSLLITIKWLPEQLADTTGLSGVPAAEERSRVRTAELAFLAALLAVASAFYTARTFALNRRGQLTERFTRAITQIDPSQQLEVRLGGIYALERLAHESRDEYGPIMEILTAYVRSNAPASEAPPWVMSSDDEGVEGPEERPAPDIQAVLTVLRRRRRQHEGRNPLELDLRETNLRGASLEAAQLQGAILFRAQLQGATLDHAQLQGALIIEAGLQDARLDGAQLQGANLVDSQLQGANLLGADLTDAALGSVKMESATYGKVFGPQRGGSPSNRTLLAETRWPGWFDYAEAGAKEMTTYLTEVGLQEWERWHKMSRSP